MFGEFLHTSKNKINSFDHQWPNNIAYKYNMHVTKNHLVKHFECNESCNSGIFTKISLPRAIIFFKVKELIWASNALYSALVACSDGLSCIK